jgi:hypothetical protein
MGDRQLFINTHSRQPSALDPTHVFDSSAYLTENRFSDSSALAWRFCRLIRFTHFQDSRALPALGLDLGPCWILAGLQASVSESMRAYPAGRECFSKSGPVETAGPELNDRSPLDFFFLEPSWSYAKKITNKNFGSPCS